ncbi:DUF2243 domain-containing protein [Salsuginibacillus kocurii]|uniref:DUF2243 domain-containing protein n=1 Tax=Salsuginibacillus kocurii TaxID=427078 RepID=UPI0003614972|nr:DUF2243 domain-containing protein [Salsuginibacillus kocurii]
MSNELKRKYLNIGSFLLGFGFLGALDGIVFHQLLQWHSVVMHSDRSIEILSDGIFHFAVTITLISGAIILWLGGKPTDLSKGIRYVVSGILIGGGSFNLIEGIINHHILQVHRVRPDADHPLLYDLGFLASGAILLVVGLLLRRTVPKLNGKR